MSFNPRLVLATAGAIALGACNTMHSHIGDEDPGMGEAVKYNTALQTINPAPVYPATASEAGANGDKGAHAVKRYRTDTVKAVEASQTTSGGSTSGMTSH